MGTQAVCCVCSVKPQYCVHGARRWWRWCWHNAGRPGSYRRRWVRGAQACAGGGPGDTEPRGFIRAAACPPPPPDAAAAMETSNCVRFLVFGVFLAFKSEDGSKTLATQACMALSLDSCSYFVFLYHRRSQTKQKLQATRAEEKVHIRIQKDIFFVRSATT